MVWKQVACNEDYIPGAAESNVCCQSQHETVLLSEHRRAQARDNLSCGYVARVRDSSLAYARMFFLLGRKQKGDCTVYVIGINLDGVFVRLAENHDWNAS